MKLCIIDEEVVANQALKQTLIEASASLDEPFVIHTFFHPDLLEETLQKGNVYDIYFLESMFSTISGFDLVKRIKKVDPQAKIIFVSTSIRNAIYAFEVRAFDYIIKPLELNKATTLLKTLSSSINKDKNKTLFIKTSEGLKKIHMSHLLYVEVKEHYVHYNLYDKSVISVYGSLNDVGEKLLHFYDFVQTHRSFIVNLNYILSMDSKSITIGKNTEIPISKTFYISTKEKHSSFIQHKGILI